VQDPLGCGTLLASGELVVEVALDAAHSPKSVRALKSATQAPSPKQAS